MISATSASYSMSPPPVQLNIVGRSLDVSLSRRQPSLSNDDTATMGGLQLGGELCDEAGHLVDLLLQTGVRVDRRHLLQVVDEDGTAFSVVRVHDAIRDTADVFDGILPVPLEEVEVVHVGRGLLDRLVEPGDELSLVPDVALLKDQRVDK